MKGSAVGKGKLSQCENKDAFRWQKHLCMKDDAVGKGTLIMSFPVNSVKAMGLQGSRALQWFPGHWCILSAFVLEGIVELSKICYDVQSARCCTCGLVVMPTLKLEAMDSLTWYIARVLV